MYILCMRTYCVVHSVVAHIAILPYCHIAILLYFYIATLPYCREFYFSIEIDAMHSDVSVTEPYIQVQYCSIYSSAL